MFKSISLVALASLSLSLANLASAELFRYSLTTIGSGSLGGIEFTDAEIRIISFADTSQIVPFDVNVDEVANTSAEVFVAGLGAAMITETTKNIVNRASQLGGISNSTQNIPILFAAHSSFSNYDLSTPLGPLQGPAVFNGGFVFTSTAGDFILNTAGEVTYLAEVVPEPSTILGVCLAGFLLIRRRS